MRTRFSISDAARIGPNVFPIDTAAEMPTGSPNPNVLVASDPKKIPGQQDVPILKAAYIETAEGSHRGAGHIA
jgi:hypothetical protein